MFKGQNSTDCESKVRVHRWTDLPPGQVIGLGISVDGWLAQATIKIPYNLEVIIGRLDVSSSLPLMESVCKAAFT